MVKIFISYRRQDSQQIAERIFEKLEPHFPVIFYDLSTISYGNDFVETIQAGIYDSDVVLVLIGNKWGSILEERRNNPEDFVRIEVETALEQRKRVIPILIDNAPMPSIDNLPQRIAKNFVKLNAMPLPSTNPFFNTGIDELIKALNNWQSITVPPPLPPEPIKQPATSNSWRNATIGATVIALILGVLAMYAFSTREVVDIIKQTVEVPITQIIEQTVEVTRIAEDDPVEVIVTELVQQTVEVPITEIVRETVEVPVTSVVEVVQTSPPIVITATPPNSLTQAMQRPQAGVSSNAEWEAWYPEGFMQEFDGVEMLLVPAGCFMMGSEDGGSDEQPVHEQCIEEPFWIDKYEVTNEQFGSIGCSGSSSEPDQPRNCVTWFDAKDFCESRSGRLPTEKEWEYASRGPDNLVYPWGNEWNENYAVWDGNSGGKTAGVGSRPSESASWVGAYDLSGNVWEWVSSLYEDYEYDITHENDTDFSNRRVLRGGSWVSLDSSLFRASVRYGVNPSGTFNFSGFRCARS